jgi:hypothetical protein
MKEEKQEITFIVRTVFCVFDGEQMRIVIGISWTLPTASG